jgi:HD superfamily phosphohydrolase
MLRYHDRVYGEVVLDDPGVLGIIATPTFQRLKGVRQAGPSVLAFPFKTVTRYEHSLGVHHLLTLLGASRRERIAGLLHDISHTAFSHAVDFLHHTEEQAHHESIKPRFLHRPDLAAAIRAAGFEPDDFVDDTIFPLLEQPLPKLCADRVDYFLRDSLACGVTRPEEAARDLMHLTVHNGLLAMTDPDVARDVAARFAIMNRNWWAGPIEAFIYNEFAEVLRRGLDLGAINDDDLHGEDDPALAKLRNSGDPEILRRLDRVAQPSPDEVAAYLPRITPKMRWLDPPVILDNQLVPLSCHPAGRPRLATTTAAPRSRPTVRTHNA